VREEKRVGVAGPWGTYIPRELNSFGDPMLNDTLAAGERKEVQEVLHTLVGRGGGISRERSCLVWRTPLDSDKQFTEIEMRGRNLRRRLGRRLIKSLGSL
jgi:hypothetical protein